METKNNEQKCCERLVPQEWDKKIIKWRDKPFYKSHYVSFFHVPLNIAGKIKEGYARIEELGLAAEPMVITRNETFWGADVLIPISAKTDIFEIEIMSGKFATGLFEGAYGEIGTWVKKMERVCKKNGVTPKEYLYWYATCPKCAKKYESVQVVIFARID